MTTGEYKNLRKLVKKFIDAVRESAQFAGSSGPLESRDVSNQAVLSLYFPRHWMDGFGPGFGADGSNLSAPKT